MNYESNERSINSNNFKYKTSIFIGRFQPFQVAHMAILEKALKLSERVIIVIGSSKRPRTIKNPWTAEERQEFIVKSYEDKYGDPSGKVPVMEVFKERVKFVYVRDHMYNNTRWATEVYSKSVMAGASQDKDTCLIGCFKDDSSWYLKMFPQWSFEEVKPIKKDGWLVNATDIRKELFEEKYLEEKSGMISSSVYEDICAWINSEHGDKLRDEYYFIEEYKKQWESSPYPPTFVTADAVVLKSGHILMIKRGFNPGKGLWALPGGFLNQHETIENCALRELKEETSLKVPKKILEANIKDVQKFDHPLRSLRGRTITFAHLINLGEGPLPEIKAGDDAAGAHWIPLADLASLEDQVFEDHSDIIQRMTSKY